MPRGKKKLLDAGAISDFRPGTDIVIRDERGRCFVHDTQGFYADQEVKSDVLTDEWRENLETTWKTRPDWRIRMILATVHTPFLSEEGRAERLAAIREFSKDTPMFQVVERNSL